MRRSVRCVYIIQRAAVQSARTVWTTEVFLSTGLCSAPRSADHTHTYTHTYTHTHTLLYHSIPHHTLRRTILILRIGFVIWLFECIFVRRVINHSNINIHFCCILLFLLIKNKLAGLEVLEMTWGQIKMSLSLTTKFTSLALAWTRSETSNFCGKYLQP